MSSTYGLSRTFLALADPTRRAMLSRLSRGAATVGELAQPFEMSLAAIAKHLRVLETAGLVSRGRNAQFRPAALAAEPLDARRPGSGTTGSSEAKASTLAEQLRTVIDQSPEENPT